MVVKRVRKTFRKRFARKRKSMRRGRKLSEFKPNTVNTALFLKGTTGFPRRTFVKLRFADTTNYNFSSALDVANIRYRPSSAYDIDPNLASTATVGFAEYATFYQYYRVHGATIRVRVFNQANIPVGIVVFPANVDPGASLSYLNLRDYAANPGAVQKVCASLTGAPSAITITKHYSAAFVLGSNTYKYDDSYASLTNGNPGNNWYIGFGAFSLEGAAIAWTGKIDYTVDMVLEVEFFEPKLLTA